MSHNFIICNADTDSVSFKKPDGKPFSDADRTAILNELNALMPENIVWKDDNHFRRFIVFKAKNYVMDDGNKVKIKGSGLKGSKKEPALKEFTNEIIDLLLKDRKDQVLFAYIKKCVDVQNITDITPWCFKATVTKKVLNPETTFNKKVLAAIGDTPVSEGDKVYLFYKDDGSLCLREKFNGEFDRSVLLGKIRDTFEIFSNVLDTELFPDMTLKRNQGLLELLKTPISSDIQPRNPKSNESLTINPERVPKPIKVTVSPPNGAGGTSSFGLPTNVKVTRI